MMRLSLSVYTLVVLAFLTTAQIYAQRAAPPFPPQPPASTQVLTPLSAAPHLAVATPTPILVRDSQALQAVQATLNALGGTAAFSQVQNWQAQALVQGANERASMSGTVTWETAGAEFRIQSSLASQSGLILTGHGNPVFVANGNSSSALPAYIMNALLIPAYAPSILFHEFQDPNHSITYRGTTTLNSKPVTLISIVPTVPSDTFYVGAQTWYLDAGTGLPDRVEYKIPATKDPRVSLTGALDFSDWRATPLGVLYPFQIVRYQGGRKIEVLTVQSVTVNGTISPSDFDPPTGGAQ